MSKPVYKLHVTLEIDDLSLPGDNSVGIAVSRAIMYLEGMNLVVDGFPRYDGIPITVTLNREGDKSAANLLAPINDRHFKHGKIPVTDIIK